MEKIVLDKLIWIFESNRMALYLRTLIPGLKTSFKNELKRQLNIFFERLQNQAGEGTEWWLPFHREMKQQALMKQVDLAQWILTHTVESEENELMLAQVLKPFYEKAGKKGVEKAIKVLEGELGRKIIFKNATSWVQDNPIIFGRKYSRLISQTTNERIRETLAEAIREGKDLQFVINQIQDKVLGPNEIYRAEMVARTELARAYNISSLLTDSAMGLKEFEWYGCNPDCEICSEWMANNPYTAEGIEYIIMHTHPNCMGTYVPIVPDDFVPERDSVDFVDSPFETVNVEMYKSIRGGE